MSENALTVRDEMTLAETMTLGKMMVDSKFFDDAKDAAKAVVKILAGRELGFGPIASMTGINVIKGKIAVGANLMAASVKRDPRYDYTVVDLTPERCEIDFFGNGRKLGTSTFTIENARAAGVGKAQPPGKPGTMLQMFPKNLLFARAMSNGVRWYCPDAFGGGPVYTPEELGATVDESGGVLDVPSRDVTPEQRASIDDAAELAEAEREAEDIDPLTPADNRPDTPPTARRSWPKETIDAVVDANLARPAKHAVKMLHLSDVLRTTDDLALVLEWANHYRGQREGGKSPEQSAAYADGQIKGVEGE